MEAEFAVVLLSTPTRVHVSYLELEAAERCDARVLLEGYLRHGRIGDVRHPTEEYLEKNYWFGEHEVEGSLDGGHE